MKAKNKICNWKLNLTIDANGNILEVVEDLVVMALNTKTNTVNYSYRISKTSAVNSYIVVLSIEFTELNYYNFFKEVNHVTAKISRLLIGSSFIEETWTNNL